MFDNIIISPYLLADKKGFHVSSTDGQIFKPEWLLHKNPKTGEVSPDKTYGNGDRYFGGYSDHLPVYVTLKK